MCVCVCASALTIKLCRASAAARNTMQVGGAESFNWGDSPGHSPRGPVIAI